MDELAAILSEYLSENEVDYYMRMLAEYGTFETLDNIDMPFTEVGDRIKQLRQFGVIAGYAGLIVNTIDFQPDDGRTHYLRLGALPEGNSYNHIMEEPEEGVSVFALDEDGNPIVDNLQLIADLTIRYYKTATIVTGDRVGTGFDGEPLIKNVKTISIVDVDTTAVATKVLEANFKTKNNDADDPADHLRLFYRRDVKQMAYYLDGVEYLDPVEGFDVRMGKDRLYG